MQEKKRKQKPSYAFIDSQNLNLGVKSMGWALDFRKLRVYLKNKYNIQQAFLFIGHVDGNEKLYLSLQRYGYIVIFKPTLEFKKGKEKIIKGNVDAELVLHTMIEKDNYDKAYIISGDGDFHCLVEYLHDVGKLGRVLVPNNKYSSLLRKFQNHIVSIQGLKSSLEMKNKMTKISVRSKS